MKKAEYKVPGGKLIATEISLKDGVIDKLKIFGDFFMHPEAVIIDLEKALLGNPASKLETIITCFFDNSDITLFGVEPSDFAKVIRLALDSK